ncbi:hypothetical protein LBMAG33_6580 [Candidatus Levyibacteriota bacterium]|nr:hypothetical protein LBMAG33_6580 [Candidatus Levybacteria bacterium]
MGLFIIIVIVGVFAVLIMTNQSPKTNNKQTLDELPKIKITPETMVTEIANPITETGKGKISKGIIKTNKGGIELDFYINDAPNTISNFVKKAETGFYKNLTFHRIEDWVAQGGDPSGNGTGGGSMSVEFNTKPFIVGSLGIASRGDGKVQNDAQFFITKKDSPHLNGSYTNFGIVTKGMDVVNKLEIGDKILEITIY